jgi:hypothetical protein
VTDRGRLVALVTLLALAWAAAPAQALEATVAEIVRNPPRFAGQPVTVRGIMGTVQPVAASRQMLTIFDLAGDGGVLKVLVAIRPACSPGSPVTVEGRFETVRNVEGQTFVNLVEATAVVCR